MPFECSKLAIPDVILIQSKVFTDARGYFSEVYKKSELKACGISTDFIQGNHSRSVKNVLRGLHFQKAPHTQAKLVMVTRGEIFDVAVDIRPDSKTYGQWVSQVLQADEKTMLYVPEGFAHGFCVLSEVADVVYLCNREYAPQAESGIVWNDPKLAIKWPVADPIVSDKDKTLPGLPDQVGQ